MDYPFFTGLWADVTLYFGDHPLAMVGGVGAIVAVGIWIGKLLEWKGNANTTFTEIKESLKGLTLKIDGLMFKGNQDLVQGKSPMNLTAEGKKLAQKVPQADIEYIVGILSKTFSGRWSTDRQAEIGGINNFLLAMMASNTKGTLPEKIKPVFVKISNEEGRHITEVCWVVAFRVHEQILKELAKK